MVKVIAEIGINHAGDIKLVKELINILFQEYNTFNRLDILERETPSRKKLKKIARNL